MLCANFIFSARSMSLVKYKNLETNISDTHTVIYDFNKTIMTYLLMDTQYMTDLKQRK